MDTKKPTDTAATVIIGQRIRAGSELEYEAWQEDMNREASKYPGFLGAEINPPTAVQPEWVVVYRFDSVAHVQAWCRSERPWRAFWLSPLRSCCATPASSLGTLGFRIGR